jgi:hypothetical protein
MWRAIPLILWVLLLILVYVLSWFLFHMPMSEKPVATASISGTIFIDSFNKNGTLFETGLPNDSSDPNWWLDSGAKMLFLGTIAQTLQGDLPQDDRWHALYAKNNPSETDQGAHPQNVFRLISRTSWENVQAQMEFNIVRDNLSASAGRDPSNGILIMSRYSPDGQTFYYAGLRVDGEAVIKKKYQGTYYIMAERRAYSGLYDGSAHPSLLPHNQWIGIRSETKTSPDGSVTVVLSMRDNGQWKELISATDSGEYAGTPPIIGPAQIGIRADFMDVQFHNFRAESI